MRELDQRTQGKLQSWKLCLKKIKILQLLNEAEYLLKNYEDWGGRYLSRPYMEAKVDDTLRDLHSSSYDMKFDNCFIIHSK